MPLLTVSELSIGYGSNIVAENISFKVDEGDYLCIVGENGAGKSTLMRTLLRLQQPVSGQILTGKGLRNNEIGYLVFILSTAKKTVQKRSGTWSAWELLILPGAAIGSFQAVSSSGCFLQELCVLPAD